MTELYLERVYSPEQKSITLKLLMKLEFHNQQAGVRPVFSRAGDILLTRRVGNGCSRWPVRQAFRLPGQHEKEDMMQYLDALGGLRSQGFL